MYSNTRYAFPADVTAAYEGELPAGSEARIEYLLDAVSARLTAMIPALPGWITAGLVEPAVATDVVCQAVLRQIRNPGQGQQSTQSAGPFSVTTSYGGAGESPRAYFEAADLAVLRPGRSSAAGSMRLSSPFLPRRRGPRY